MNPETNRSASNESRKPSHMEAGSGAELSPPHTWTESDSRTSADCEEDLIDNRLLFVVVASLPDGAIHHSKVMSDSVSSQDLSVGENLLPLLDTKGRSFLITAAATSQKQRIFCRVKCKQMSNACELLCEFDPPRARVTALSVRPAFGPTMPFHSICFTTKHSATLALMQVDYASIPYLGHLPTDVLGRSIISLICAADVNVVRQAHFDLFNSRGKVVKSVAPLRFVAYNGALVPAETEWSAYVNPWTKRIEMIVARHRIIAVPVGDANVLAAPSAGTQLNVLPPALAKVFEDELRLLMSKPVPSKRQPPMCQPAPRPADLAASLLPAGVARPSDITAYIDRIVEQLVVAGGSATTTGVSNVPNKFITGQAVPKAEQSNDLPLTYNQINCLENVNRLLHSQSRPESPSQSDSLEDSRRPLHTVPLTREALLQHTRRWEEDYRDTWNRRLLKRISSEAIAGPPAKNIRPMTASTPPTHWPQAQREEFYRSLAPNPPPPPGKNFQITTVPLLPSDTSTSASTPTPERAIMASAFTAVAPKSSLPLRELPPPIALAIQDSHSVIQTKLAGEALLMLQERV